DMHEDGAAAASDPVSDVPVEDDADIVQPVGAEHALMAGGIGEADRPVVVAVRRGVAPAVPLANHPHFEARPGVETAAAPVEAAEHPHGGDRGAAVALPLPGRDARPSEGAGHA